MLKKNRYLKYDKFDCNIKKCKNKKFEIYFKKNNIRRIKKIIDLIIFNQINTKKNLILNNEIDLNFDKFFAIFIEIKNVKYCRKKFRIIKYKQTIIKINTQKIEIILNSKTKINLINNIFVKQFKLILFYVFNCQIINVNNYLLKIYNVYFVQFKIKNENDINRFFNDNFLKINFA